MTLDTADLPTILTPPEDWTLTDLLHVRDLKPDPYHPRHTAGEWATQVAAARQPNETPVQAATRLRWYVTLYTERHGQPPALHHLARTCSGN